MVAETEILRDDCTRLAAKCRAAGVTVQEEVVGNVFHIWPLFWFAIPEASGAIDRIRGFLESGVEVPQDALECSPRV